MKNCPLTGNPCGCDRVFTVSEKIREFTYTTDCCRNCVEDYVRLRNEAADSEAAQLEAMDQAQAQIQKPAPVAETNQHAGVIDLLAKLGIDVSLLNKPIVVQKIGTVKATPPAAGKRCPGCDCTIQDLRKMKKMGCPECYVTFATELEAYLPKIQGGKKEHKGKQPSQAPAQAPDVKLSGNSEDLVKILHEQMAQAISEENYEKAGKCRDLIKKYGGDVGEGPAAA